MFKSLFIRLPYEISIPRSKILNLAQCMPPAIPDGIVNFAGEGLEHLNNDGDDGFWGVVLAAFVAFGEGELAEEIFVDVAEDILGVEIGVAEG